MVIYIWYIYTYTCIHITYIYINTQNVNIQVNMYICIYVHVYVYDWCCFYYFVRNILVALLEALCAKKYTYIYICMYMYVYHVHGSIAGLCRVPGPSVRNCAGSPNNRGRRWPKLSAMDVTAKVICGRRLVLVPGPRWFAPFVTVPYAPTPLPLTTHLFLGFLVFSLPSVPSNVVSEQSDK